MVGFLGDVAPAFQDCSGVTIDHWGGLLAWFPIHVVPEGLEILVGGAWAVSLHGDNPFLGGIDRPLPGTLAVSL